MNEQERRAEQSPDQHFDRQIDRLVDGELNAVERWQLLAECDEREGAWRRCALAFLEAQSWRAEMTALAAPVPASVPASSPVIETKPARENYRRRRWVRTQSRSERDWSTMASAPWALAASVLIAFGLGWMARHHSASEGLAFDPGFQAPEQRVSETAIDGRAIVDSDWTSDSGNEPVYGATDSPETITLVMDCGPDGEQRQIELPVLPAGGDDLASLEQSEPVVSAELQAALLRMGHRVNERRQLVPLVLEDGRRLVVPVDEIDFTPVEESEYQ